MGTPKLDLTPREHQIVVLVAHGLSNAEIARELRIAVSTVGVHLTSAFWKMGVSNRTAAAVALFPDGAAPRWQDDGVQRVMPSPRST
jgi:DNA-binding NarL/FixJ family response regulator